MKVLIIRFSSIGDLTQALSIPGLIKEMYPQAEIHFVTRLDLAGLLENNPNLKKVWTLDRSLGLSGLLELIGRLKKENFTHVYDAHHNLRSFLIRFLVRSPHVLVKPMNRFKRFMLIRFRKNYFEKPFSGQRDLLKPLEKWGIPFKLPPPPQIFFTDQELERAKALLAEQAVTQFVALAPSAAYFLKRWPLEHWHSLVKSNPQQKFVVLAGPADTFTSELNVYPNVVNLTGLTSLRESAAVISQAHAVVANDTGLLHFAEQLGKPSVALMGPAPFGFPSRPSTVILERDLICRPCSKHGQGPCVNPNFHECLRAISPDEVGREMRKLLESPCR